MNKNNIFLQIAVVLLLGISSTSFSMRYIEQEAFTNVSGCEKNLPFKKDSSILDKQNLYKMFNLTEKELKQNDFTKLNSNKKFAFWRKKDGTERFLIKRDDEKLEDIIGFKFNTKGDILFFNHGKVAEVMNLNTGKILKVGSTLSKLCDSDSNKKYAEKYYSEYGSTNDEKSFAEYGFTNDEAEVFLTDYTENLFKIINIKTGETSLALDFRKCEYFYPDDIFHILSKFKGKKDPFTLILNKLFSINDKQYYKCNRSSAM